MISLCLQCCPLDVQSAFELTQLICTMEPSNRGREFFLVFRKDCPNWVSKEFQKLAGQKFKAQACVARNHDTGHPAGSNMLAASAFIEMEILRRSDVCRNDGFLLFEPDCVPMAFDWMDQLSAEWDRAKSEGKEAFGHWHQQGDGDTLHLNGNAVFRTDFFERHPTTIVGCGAVGWDYWFRDRLIPLSFDSYAIYQLYNRATIGQEELESVTKHGRRPALLHGIKDGSARKCVYDMLFKNSLAPAPVE